MFIVKPSDASRTAVGAGAALLLLSAQYCWAAFSPPPSWDPMLMLNVTLDANNQLAVANLCNLADWMTLAIELLSARVNDISPQQIAGVFSVMFDSWARAECDLPPHERRRCVVLEVSWNWLR